jgi:uncharacterized LabA/DUF88 family protein
MHRVSIFVDGANMYYAQRRLGWFIDFRRVLNYFGRELGNVIAEAYYYTGVDPMSRTRDANFHDYLMYSGYTVRTKVIKQVTDDTTGEVFHKANLDVEMVIDIFNSLNLYDVCILMSGDGDFERALEMVRSRGKRVAVVAYPDMTARELRNVVGRNYFDLRDLEQYIARTDRVPEPAQVTEGVPILRQGHSELPPHDDEE